MPTFTSYDGTTLAYHVEGAGPVVVCQPGGPGRASTAAAAAHAAAGLTEFAPAARDGFFEGYVPDRDAITAKLAALTAPALVIAGELDASPTPAAAAEVAKLFPSATVVTLTGSAHFPWLDNPTDLAAALAL